MRIEIENVCSQKIAYWTAKATGEVSGMGLVKPIIDPKTNNLVALKIYEVFMIKQASGAAHSDLDPEDLAKKIMEIAERDLSDHLRFWWHSHATMGVSWSGTDENTISQFGMSDWFVSMVVNKSGDRKTRLDIFKLNGYNHHFRYDLDDKVIMTFPEEVRAEADAEFERCQNKWQGDNPTLNWWNSPNHSQDYGAGFRKQYVEDILDETQSDMFEEKEKESRRQSNKKKDDEEENGNVNDEFEDDLPF